MGEKRERKRGNTFTKYHKVIKAYHFKLAYQLSNKGTKGNVKGIKVTTRKNKNLSKYQIKDSIHPSHHTKKKNARKKTTWRNIGTYNIYVNINHNNRIETKQSYQYMKISLLKESFRLAHKVKFNSVPHAIDTLKEIREC